MKYKTTSYDTLSIKDFEQFDVKVIIFDFDYTLYQNLDWGIDWYDNVIRPLRRMLSFLTMDEFDRLCKKYNVRGSRVFENTCLLIKDEKLPCSIKDFRDLTQTFRFEADYENAQLFPSDLLEKLAKTYPLYVVSNTAESKIKFDCDKMHLDLSPFKGVYQNRFDENDLSKAPDFKMIADNEGVEYSKVLVVGDSEIHDLEPASRLGMQTLLMLRK